MVILMTKLKKNKSKYWKVLNSIKDTKKQNQKAFLSGQREHFCMHYMLQNLVCNFQHIETNQQDKSLYHKSNKTAIFSIYILRYAISLPINLQCM